MPLTAEQNRILSHCFLFQENGVSPAAQLILERCPVCHYRKGEIIYSREQFERAVGILLSGGASVLKGRGVVLNTLSPGDSFGVASLFTDSDRYVATVVADRSATVLLLRDEHLRELFAADGSTSLGYIRFLSNRICFLNRKLDAFTAPSAEGRVAVYLLENAREGRVHIAGGYAELSRMLGIGRASLYRCLDSLEDGGIIRRSDREVLLLDPGRLRNITG